MPLPSTSYWAHRGHRPTSRYERKQAHALMNMVYVDIQLLGTQGGHKKQGKNKDHDDTHTYTHLQPSHML